MLKNIILGIFLSFIYLLIIVFVQALEKSPQAQHDVDSDEYLSELEGSFLNDFSDIDGSEGEVVNFVCHNIQVYSLCKT